MAQTYEIDINRYNGQDYDTLLPTPASHASTHQANGSDPLTLQAGNYGALSIPTSAYQNASVSRTKLAQDALYSPVVTKTDSFSVLANEAGKTYFVNASTKDVEVSVSSDATAGLSVGADFAVYWFYARSITLVLENVRVCLQGDTTIYGGLNKQVRITINDIRSMVALKKMLQSSTNGDIWAVIGNVEVAT